MLKIDPNVSLGIKIVMFLLGFIAATAHQAPDHLGGAAIAGNIEFWCTTLDTALAGLFALVGTGAVPSSTLIGKVH